MFCESFPWPSAPWRRTNLDAAWILLEKLIVFSMARNKKAATALLRDELQMQDFAKPVFLRASRILGPVSRFRNAPDSAPDESCVHVLVALGILCNGLCTAQRFHLEGKGTDVSSWMPGWTRFPLSLQRVSSVFSTVLPQSGDKLLYDLW